MTSPAPGNQVVVLALRSCPCGQGSLAAAAAIAALWVTAAGRSGGLIFHPVEPFRACWAAQSGSQSPRFGGTGCGAPSRCCGPVAGLNTCIGGFYRTMDERGAAGRAVGGGRGPCGHAAGEHPYFVVFTPTRRGNRACSSRKTCSSREACGG